MDTNHSAAYPGVHVLRLLERQQCRLFPRLEAMGLNQRGLGRLLLHRQQELLLDLDRLPGQALH